MYVFGKSLCDMVRAWRGTPLGHRTRIGENLWETLHDELMHRFFDLIAWKEIQKLLLEAVIGYLWYIHYFQNYSDSFFFSSFITCILVLFNWLLVLNIFIFTSNKLRWHFSYLHRADVLLKCVYSDKF